MLYCHVVIVHVTLVMITELALLSVSLTTTSDCWSHRDVEVILEREYLLIICSRERENKKRRAELDIIPAMTTAGPQRLLA